jgi:hypothetical protein
MPIVSEVFLLQEMIFYRIARDTGDFVDNHDETICCLTTHPGDRVAGPPLLHV